MQEIELKSLVQVIDETVHARGLVPLISDPTENTDTFLAFQQTVIIEMKALILAKASIGIEGVRERMREKLVGAIKNGQTLLLRLTDALPDLVGTYADDKSFPTCQLFECALEEIDDEVAEQHFGGFGGQVGAAQSAGVAGYSQPKDGSKRSTRGVFKVTDKEWLQKLFKESEYEAGAPIARPGFRVVVTTNLAADAIKEKLAHLIPLPRCNIIAVKQQ